MRVTAGRDGALGVTGTGSALLLRVTPVPILTPGARAAPKSCPAGALTRDRVTPRLQSVSGVAAAGLTAPGPPEVPEEGGTAATVPPQCVGAAGALPADRVTEAGFSLRWAPYRAGAPGVTAAAPAAPWAQGTAVEARPAVGTASAVAVVQTALAMSAVGVTGGWVTGINIVVALAGPAGTPSGVISRPGAPKVAGGAAVTAGSCIAGGTEAQDTSTGAVHMAGGPMIEA